MVQDRDALDELIEERTAHNPDFPGMVKTAERRRALLKQFGKVREERGRSQTAVAAEMNTSQSSVARLEGAADDVRLSTLDRYAEALGFRVQWHLVPIDSAEAEPPVVIHGAG